MIRERKDNVTMNTLTPKNENPSTYSFTVFPDALNYAGSLFGGKLLSEMDLAASNAARRLLYHTDCDGLVTAHLSEVNFKSPGNLGDIIEIHCNIEEFGRSSIAVGVEVTKEDRSGKINEICSAKFIFVALKNNRPYPHQLNLN